MSVKIFIKLSSPLHYVWIISVSVCFCELLNRKDEDSVTHIEALSRHVVRQAFVCHLMHY